MSNSVSENTFLYVPANMIEMYMVRTNWSQHADYIRPISDYPVNPVVEGDIGEAVDLGLSVKWASWNVGASAPYEVGSKFAWGETAPKWDYDWLNYQWCNGDYTTLTKYNTSSEYGIVDNKTSLDPEDDAVRVHWGGTWRMPTDAEFQELLDSCTKDWVSENGVYGCRFTSRKTGFADKSIFLPFEYSGTDGFRFGDYWTTVLKSYSPSAITCDLSRYSGKNSATISSSSRYEGNPIRPVCD